MTKAHLLVGSEILKSFTNTVPGSIMRDPQREFGLGKL